MKLKSVRIQNFRSIDDSGTFEIDDSTCLVGKNEAGKTAVLQALEVLNSAEGNDKYNKTRDYPRRYLNQYEERHDGEEAEVLETVWELDPTDKVIVNLTFGPDAFTNDTVTIKKRYGSTGSNWTTGFDEESAIKHLIKNANLSASEAAPLNGVESGESLVQTLENRTDLTEKQQALLDKVSGFRDKRPILKVIDILHNRLPKFLYFSHYDRMSGKVSLDQLEQDIANSEVSEGDRVFLDFIEFAGTSIEELKSIEQSEDLIAKIEGASNNITDQIFEYWTQNQSLEVEFSHYEGREGDEKPFNDGTVMEARVKNQIHRMTVPFSERSAGFVWFFSFLIKFAKVAKEYDRLIILLDEPGLTLHAKAQADLLRYFTEKLESKHQLIFSTHSPFMVPADNLSRVRIVEDVVKQIAPMKYESEGTKVKADVLATDKDTVFPLQSALGYEISQSLFVGKNTLLVEGPSDILYMQAMSNALKEQGKNGLDARWTLCPTGGIDKINAFVSLFGGNDIHIAVFSDYADGQKNKVQRIKESELLEQGHFFTVADFCDKTEGDIEDLIEASLYLKIVNEAYALKGENKLTAAKLAAADESTERNVRKVEAYFRTLPDEIPMYDHYTPAGWLIRHPEVFDKDAVNVKDTLERAQTVFDTYNKLLPN